MGNTAAVFGSILTGAYWKKNVDANYGISSNVYTIGVDLTNPNGQYSQTVLDPGNGLKKFDGVDGLDGIKSGMASD